DGRRAVDGDLRRPLPGDSSGRRPAQAAARRAPYGGGRGRAGPLAAALGLAQGHRDRRLRRRDLRAGLHTGRASLRPVAQSLKSRRRVVLDWTVSIACAIAFVLAFEAEVAKAFRIPSASMDATLHCARPAQGCRAEFSDRVLVDRVTYR